MFKKYLLTYEGVNCPSGTFKWFDTEEDMNNFIINKSDIFIIAAFKISNAEQIPISAFCINGESSHFK
jgi:hypothetical protein